MVNNVIEVVNYVIAAGSSLLNFMIADKHGCLNCVPNRHFCAARLLTAHDSALHDRDRPQRGAGLFDPQAAPRRAGVYEVRP